MLQRQSRGRFITLEGGEGTGKSTQIRHLIERLQAFGLQAIKTREPGGSEGAERIRSLILAAGQSRYSALTETLLFFAARSDHLEHVIRPELLKGAWVICDRFSDSTRVYQGCMGTIGQETLDSLESLVIAETTPDLTIILDLPAEIGLERAVARRGDSAADGFEAENIEFHQGLRQCYLDLAQRYPDRCIVIDALGSEADVTARIWAVLSDRFSDLMRDPTNG